MGCLPVLLPQLLFCTRSWNAVEQVQHGKVLCRFSKYIFTDAYQKKVFFKVMFFVVFLNTGQFYCSYK